MTGGRRIGGRTFKVGDKFAVHFSQDGPLVDGRGLLVLQLEAFLVQLLHGKHGARVALATGEHLTKATAPDDAVYLRGVGQTVRVCMHVHRGYVGTCACVYVCVYVCVFVRVYMCACVRERGVRVWVRRYVRGANTCTVLEPKYNRWNRVA